MLGLQIINPRNHKEQVTGFHFRFIMSQPKLLIHSANQIVTVKPNSSTDLGILQAYGDNGCSIVIDQ